jgi:hypothetical protein
MIVPLKRKISKSINDCNKWNFAIKKLLGKMCVGVNRSLSEHLRIQRRLNPCTKVPCSKDQRTFVTLHLTLSMSQKLFISIKEWGNYGGV